MHLTSARGRAIMADILYSCSQTVKTTDSNICRTPIYEYWPSPTYRSPAATVMLKMTRWGRCATLYVALLLKSSLTYLPIQLLCAI